ncbi:MAG: DUF2283 domain-containing protein [Deltaproteobacteria bacterium]|nr:DUF2283 domain-containing protein [Deltaproteobacteria bacterium]
MRMHYSQDADAIYIRLKEDPIQSTDEVAENIIMDFDAKGNVIGIEILFASEKVDVSELIVQSFDKVMVGKAAVA